MNRRDFINKSAVALTLGSMISHEVFAASTSKLNKGRIGIQLYSVKEVLPNDFMGTLKKLSGMGYSSVELYGGSDSFFGHTLKEMKAIVNGLGMSISGMHLHTVASMLPEDTRDPAWDLWKRCAEDLRSGGGTWAMQAGLPDVKSIDDLKRTAAHFNRIGEVCKKGGVKFAFHNHHYEFSKIDGVTILDYLLENTDPKIVFFQLDLGHAVNGGGDPVRYLRAYPGRFAIWHVSDFDAASRTYTDVGKGSVPYPALFDIANSSGLQTLTVEQEKKADIFASCQVAFDYLKQFKWTKVVA